MKVEEIVYMPVKLVNTIMQKNNYNKYSKKDPIEKMILLLLFHQFTGLEYGRSMILQLEGLERQKEGYRFVAFDSNTNDEVDKAGETQEWVETPHG